MYIDLFFILNACLNFLVLSMVNLIAKRNAGFLKRLLAALVGALSACLFLILPTDSGFIRLGFGFCTAFFMTSIAFVPLKKGERLKLTLGLYVAAMLMSGALNLFYTGTGKGAGIFSFLLLAGVCFLGFKAGFFYWDINRKKRGYRMQAVLFCHGKRVVLPALLDTGNHLYTYEGHRPVHMVEREAVLSLLDENPVYHMVAYQAVGTKNGALLAVTIDQILLQQGEKTITLKQPVIGLYEQTLSPSGEYRMLLHADTLLKN